MNRFSVIDTPLEGLKVLKRKKLKDKRGFFERLFCFEELAEVGWTKPIVQINHSFTANKASVRGLHYQLMPHVEMKIVSCIQGSILDVAVDIRKNSKTFLQWFGVELSDENDQSLLIPEGFAHGFQTLTTDCELIYFHNEYYNQDYEAGIRFNDPTINVNWKLEPGVVSDRDLNHPLISNDFSGVLL